METNPKVCVYKAECYSYPQNNLSFRPSIRYPEYIFKEISEEENKIYDAVRGAFILMGLDSDNIGTVEWNPFRDIVHPGNTVLIKPNLVMDKNAFKEGGTDCLYTQPSVVAPVVDYVLKALNGDGKIIIGDAPMQECDFLNLTGQSGYNDLVKFYQLKNLPVEIVDFRGLKSNVVDGIHYQKQIKDDRGTIVSLGEDSLFFADSANDGKRRVTNYDPRIMVTHHKGHVHEYYISKYVLEADVIINMPKPKSHRKAGVTISLKNFVGANTRKEFLPHHTMGSIAEGGDEYDKKSLLHYKRSQLLDLRNISQAEKKYNKAKRYQFLIRNISRILKIIGNRYSEGSWYGNDTISRTILDLNRIVYFADKNGVMKQDIQRNVFIVADMIVSGEKEGPVAPTPKEVGLIACGNNPVFFDEIISKIMGFDWKKIPSIKRAAEFEGRYCLVKPHKTPTVVSNDLAFNNENIQSLDRERSYAFEPTDGWKGHIEID